MDRGLDGVYFRVKRGDKWESVCFSDLEEKQMREVLEGKSTEWLTSLCVVLAQRIREIGDQFDIVRGDA